MSEAFMPTVAGEGFKSQCAKRAASENIDYLSNGVTHLVSIPYNEGEKFIAMVVGQPGENSPGTVVLTNDFLSAVIYMRNGFSYYKMQCYVEKSTNALSLKARCYLGEGITGITTVVFGGIAIIE